MSKMNKFRKLDKQSDGLSSISDLMSGLMIIFLFISVAFMSKVADENISIKKQHIVKLLCQIKIVYLSLTKQPTMDKNNPTDAALLAMKLSIAKAIPIKLKHTPTMPILMPLI